MHHVFIIYSVRNSGGEDFWAHVALLGLKREAQGLHGSHPYPLCISYGS